jgi:sporulation integral membrane protein YtvI
MKDNKKIRLFKVLGITIAAILLMYIAIKLLYPFFIALVFAFCINPFVSFLEKRTKLSRGLSVFLTMFIVIGGLLIGAFFLSMELVAGIQYLIQILPLKLEMLSAQFNRLMMEQVLPLYNRISSVFNELDSEQQQRVLEYLEKTKDGLFENAGDLFKDVMQGFLAFIQGLPSLATSFFFGLLGTFFISKDWNKLKQWAGQRLPTSIKTKGSVIWDNLKFALFGYVKSQAILVSITTITVIIGLFILKIDNALSIGILIGIVDVLPYLGTGFVLVPWAIYGIVSGDLFVGVGLITLYIIVVIQRNLIEPKVLSSSIGLNTFATIISMYVGLKLFGFSGLIIGPVTLVIIDACIKANVFKEVWGFIQGK